MIPTREQNPFSTCWTRPGALPYRFAHGESLPRLVQCLAVNHWRGQIVGPHGVGKSALLAALIGYLRVLGKTVDAVTLRDCQRRLPDGFLPRSRRGGDTIVAVDGFEILSRWRRHWLELRCRATGTGLIVTAHCRMGLPLLAELTPNLDIVQQLVVDLTGDPVRRLHSDVVVDSFRAHNGNVREIFFDLYDRYERQSRQLRTQTDAHS